MSPPRSTHSNAPLATGLIIAASVIVAAGIAIYESPQVRQWVDQSRRKIAIALHSLGDEIQPRRRPSEDDDEFEERKRRRQEIVRRNRQELIRRAREEGIAVDLDELTKIGTEDVEMAERRDKGANRQKSFDDLVGSDGMLRKDTGATTTGKDSSDQANLRRRGMAGFAAGSAAGAAMTNPFHDDVIFDNDDDEAPSPKPFSYVEPGTRESSATLEGDAVRSPSTQLIDLTPESIQYTQLPEDPQTASIPQSVADETENATAQSFYSFTSSPSHSYHQEIHTYADAAMADEEDIENVSAGTLTPRSERSAFTGASIVGSHADDIAVLSLQNDDDHDARSEAGFTDAGLSEAGFSETGFSEISRAEGEGERVMGVMTPSSWTDVGSDDESEWGGPAQGGNISQINPNM